MRRLRNSISFANVIATLALVMSMGGTAYAAKLVITGAHVKNGSLTGIDVKTGSLTAAKLDAKARESFKGADGSNGTNGSAGTAGSKGSTGPRGPEGLPGPQGLQGVPGDPAAVVTSFASRDTGYLASVSSATPNPGHVPWYDYNCAGITGPSTPSPASDCVGDDGNQHSDGVGVIDLIASDTAVVALQGMAKDVDETRHQITTRNNITIPWKNNLTGMATVTVQHNGNANTATSIHERLECGLQYANATTPNTFEELGEPQMVSAFGTNELVTMTLIGSKNIEAGTYNVRVVCSDMDYASTADNGWRFARGNLTAFAARNE